MAARFARGVAVVGVGVTMWMLSAWATPEGAASGGEWVSQESTSLLLSADGSTLYSANFDAGSVSKIDAASGERTGERALGRDIRRVALSADGRWLAATDMLGGRVYVLDARTLEVEAKAEVGARPFGVVFDTRSGLFWVAVFEDAKLVAIDVRGRVRREVPVLETPRGLALTGDGRLLVSHSMIGAVSIVSPERTFETRVVRLAETHDPDEFVSQGKPRLLDDIAISPDGSEAWLAHVLWNFDHPFQFRSTIFPAVSVLSLEPGEEAELVAERKELFRQIDVRDGASKTRIVSNPHDVEFSEDGARAYLTLAGSEDLAVFDLARAAGEGQERRARRRGKLSQGGAQVVQILRHLPGDLPRGLAVAGRKLFVQNAMSFDLARVDTGGASAFARARVDAPAHAALVARDPVEPAQRRGKRLFFSGNSDDFAELPPTGDFWMSCASCHVDGFNFTNRFLIEDTKVSGDARVVHGHTGLATLVGGDFRGDYIRMIQDTQGGFGADERMDLPRVDPAAPGAEAAEMMDDLHVYVTARENLPFLSTWLRVEMAGDDDPTEEWTSPAACAGCHSEIFDQWASSNHRLMSTSHPYYRVVEDLAAAEEGEGFRRWCMGCHNPKYVASGRGASRGEGHLFEPGGERLIAAGPAARTLDEGTDCLFCHRVTRVERAGGNASLSVDLAARPRYPFEGHANPWLRYIGDRLIESRPVVHRESYMRAEYSDPAYCGSCHSEFAPGSGAVISDTYGEWRDSPFNAPDDPSRHRTCVDCHMHADVARIGEPIPGTSTDGGRRKPNVATHWFSGGNPGFLAARSAEAAAQSRALLERAAELDVDLEGAELVVRVRNTGAGHALPTGVADLRQLWLFVRVEDAAGRVVLESGALGPDGALPADARIFNKVLGDAGGKPVGLRFWRFETLISDTRIPAGGAREERFALPPEAQHPIRATVELRFRSFPQWVTDRVRAEFPDVPVPEVLVLERASSESEGAPLAR